MFTIRYCPKNFTVGIAFDWTEVPFFCIRFFALAIDIVFGKLPESTSLAGVVLFRR